MEKIIETEDFDVFYEQNAETTKWILDKLINDYYKKFNAFDGECIYQNNECNIYASDVLAEIADKIFRIEYHD